ncbi:MAG: 16S rRNA (adenine(1518)-N(6)/adenine(1519)-N(6))-dimethyltransferase RsmA [Alphaproteobacteria bacterium]
MPALPALPPLREVIARYGLAPKKNLGQNFLLDPALLGRIARTAGVLTDCTVIEIGPGPGGLTRALLDQGAAHIIAIEQDERCIAALQELQQQYPSRLTLVTGDALTFKPQALSTIAPYKIVANLPYNIATALLLHWFKDLTDIASITIMLQKEVALRLVAVPRTSDYGRLSIITQWLCNAERAFDIAPGAFFPPPKVTSTLVHLVPRVISEDCLSLQPFLQQVTRTAFSQRRKMLRSGLRSLFTTDRLIELDITPEKRPEELTIEEFLRLARAIQESGITSPDVVH